MGQQKSLAPLLGLVVVIVLGLGITYATVTGAFQVSGAEVVSSNTAFIIVAVLFLLTLPWAYRRAKQGS